MVGEGARVLVGLVAEGVQVGARVDVTVRVADGLGVRVMVGVLEGCGVRDGVRVGDGPGVMVEVRVGVGVRVGAGVGGVPVIVNRPDTTHCMPRKICTSNSPGSHSFESGSHSVYP